MMGILTLTLRMSLKYGGEVKMTQTFLEVLLQSGFEISVTQAAECENENQEGSKGRNTVSDTRQI